MSTKINKVFVYGTLMTGFGMSLDNRSSAKLLGTDSIQATMHDIGSFPGIRLGGGSIVQGELYEFEDDKLLESLDRYEGCSSGLYTREIVTTEGGTETYVYQFNQNVEGYQVVESGDWRDYRGQRNANT